MQILRNRNAVILLHTCHARIQEFSSGGGGVQVNLTKKLFFFFFSPLLILLRSKGSFRRNLSFFKVPEGVQHFPGGSNFFFFPGGSNCLFPIETHITCDFPGGGGGWVSGPPVPPLDPHLHVHSYFIVDWCN